MGQVVDRLLKLQQPDGWLGSYAPEYRFHKYDWVKNVDKKYVPFYDGPFTTSGATTSPWGAHPVL